MKQYGIIFLLMIFFGVSAAAPEGSFLLEAESFAPQNKVTVQEHYPTWYQGVPSGGKMLRMAQGSAHRDFEVPHEGIHQIHIRTLRQGVPQNFTVKIMRDGKTEVERHFSDAGAVKEKHSSFLWHSFSTHLFSGRHRMILERNGAGRNEIDCIALIPGNTPYTPSINDFFKPLYLQVRSDSETPFYLHLWGRLPRAPWGIGHFNLTKKGLFSGPNAGVSDPDGILKKGDSSPWVNLAPYLTEMGSAKLISYAMTRYPEQHENAAFTLFFSTEPSRNGLIATLSRSGKGSGIRYAVNLSEKKIIPSGEESRKNRIRAESAGNVPGKRPLLFPVGTGLNLDSAMDPDEIRENELKALSAVGLNMLRCDYGFSGRGFLSDRGFRHKFDAFSIFYLTSPSGCLSSPRKDFDAVITERARRLKHSGAAPHTTAFLLMDEPSFPLSHVLKCPVCRKGFPAYLKKNGILSVTPEPTDRKELGAQYYWTVRYRNQILTEFFRRADGILQREIPGLPTGINIANALFTNMMEDGCDWFELFGSGALRMGWGEDWINQHLTFQLCGYLADVLDAACRKTQIPFGIYNILQRTPWEIEAKAFTELGHGVKAVQFFNYGPEYASNGDFASQRPEIYPALKRVAYAIGAFDEALTKSKRRRGDIAMLYSTVSDIWNLEKNNPYGSERAFLALLLRHAGFRTDLIHEENLRKELADYPVLFVAETHMRQSDLDLLSDWVKQGGALFLAPGALAADEYNRPLNLPFLKRKALTAGENRPLPPRLLNGIPPLDQVVYNGMKLAAHARKQEWIGGRVLARFQDSTPAVVRETFGKGSVTAFGFLPGTAYAASGKPEGDIVAGPSEFFSCRNYGRAPKEMIRDLLRNLAEPLLVCDNDLVEANLLDAGTESLAVLANWNGKKIRTTLRLSGSWDQIRSAVHGERLQIRRDDGNTWITLELGSGDILSCRRQGTAPSTP